MRSGDKFVDGALAIESGEWRPEGRDTSRQIGGRGGTCVPRRSEMDDYSEEYLNKFIDIAYRSILGRNPDKPGRAAYLRLLKDRRDFLKMLELLIDSDEIGRAHV